MLTTVITLVIAAVILSGIALARIALHRGQDQLGRILAAHRLDEAMRRSEQDSSDEEDGAA